MPEQNTPSMRVQRLRPEHASTYRALMLQAYAQHPQAFTSSAQERAALPESWWTQRLQTGADTAEVVYGVWALNPEGAPQDEAVLVGAAGLAFAARERERHKATLFGMYVHPAHRALGAGRALVQALLDHARARPGLELVQLTVSEGNPAALHLYTQMGFVTFGIEPRAVKLADTYVDKRHLWRDIKATGL